MQTTKPPNHWLQTIIFTLLVLEAILIVTKVTCKQTLEIGQISPIGQNNNFHKKGKMLWGQNDNTVSSITYKLGK